MFPSSESSGERVFSSSNKATATTTALVLASLDPILRNLLDGLTSMKALLPSLNSGTYENEAVFVRLAKEIARDLDSLCSNIVSQPAARGEFSAANESHARSLCILSEYITLPLTATFHLSWKEIYASKATTDDAKDRRLQIRRSYVYKIFTLAAATIRVYLEETSVWIGNVPSAHHLIQDASENTRKCLLPSHTRIKYLVALVHSMPSFSDLDVNANTLDDGSEAWVALLGATKRLVHSFAISGNQHRLLLEAWHGTLLVRLVDSLTAFLENPRNKTSKRSFSRTVQSCALEVLWTLLGVTNTATDNLSISFWRSVFPGVFTALYQRLMEDLPTNTPITIHIASLDSMIALLRTTLSSGSNPKKVGQKHPKTSEIANGDLLEKLTSMVAKVNLPDKANETRRDREENKDSQKCEGLKDSPSCIESGEDDAEALFFRQVKKRIETPLLRLLRKMSTSSSDRIRLKVVILCRVILSETNNVWSTRMQNEIDEIREGRNSAPLATMERIPFEICIAYQQDANATIRESSREIITNYDLGRYNDRDDPDTSLWMVRRLIELVEEVSALVRSRKSSATVGGIVTSAELARDLNLIAGYLTCLETYTKAKLGENELKGDLNRTEPSRVRSSAVRNALVSSKNFRRGLIHLFDIDMESPWNARGAFSVVNETIATHNDETPIKLRYLDHPVLLPLARDSILRSLGGLLGPKYGSLFVDEAVSDLMEAAMHAPRVDCCQHEEYESPSSVSLRADLYVCWLHEWLGSLVVAREVLLGSFSPSSTLDGKTTNSRKELRKNRILNALASSVLPLIVDSFLWNLPVENKPTKKIAAEVTYSPQTLQSNATVVVLLMELIGAFAHTLKSDMKNFLPKVFYPIIKRLIGTSSRLHSAETVRNTGIATIEVIRCSCALQSIEDLICSEHNLLIAAIFGQLRQPVASKSTQDFNNAREILTVTRTFLWIMGRINRHIFIANKTMTTNLVPKSGIVDLVSLLDHRLDHLFLYKFVEDADVETICALHSAFYEHFLCLFKVDSTKIHSFEMKEADHLLHPKPWYNLLSPYFAGCEHEASEDGSDVQPKDTIGRILELSKADVEIISNLLSRDCYLLSHHLLKSRISSCDAMTKAFRFLAFVGSEHCDPNDESNLIKNSILRQVAESWPSVKARLKSISENVLASYSKNDPSSIVLVMSQKDRNTPLKESKFEDIGVQRIFLSKLFDLIGTMCECSGDFFAGRFRHDVWPVMASHMNAILQKLQHQQQTSPDLGSTQLSRRNLKLRTHMSRSINNEARNHLALASTKGPLKMSDTERQLIESILTCICRVLDQRECGKALLNLLSSIGYSLLPFLDVKGYSNIEAWSMNCIRSILRLDCDVLRRPLLELSGSRVSSCPLRFGKQKKSSQPRSISLLAEKARHDSLSSDSVGSGTILNQCNELLKFADALPEQRIW